MRLRRAGLLLFGALLIGAAAPGDPFAAERIRTDVAFLASDALRGRDTGSPGHAAAADYVARHFAALGLKPGGIGGWHQPVPLRRATEAGTPSAAFIAAGRRIALKSGEDFGIRPSVTERVRDIDAPLVFVGHGISDARLHIDEYRGIDARGKVVIALSGTPAGIPSDIAAHLSTTKDEVAAAMGAVGFVELDPYDSRRGGVHDRHRTALPRISRPLLFLLRLPPHAWRVQRLRAVLA